MAKPAPTMKEMRAFKIGARARKFALEDCAIEGYEVLLTAIAEAQDADPELYPLLLAELEKYERRLEALQENEAEDLPES
jgi:hypothetical protein